MSGPATAAKVSDDRRQPGEVIVAALPPTKRARDAAEEISLPSAGIQIQLEQQKLERSLGKERSSAVIEDARRAEKSLALINSQSALLDKETVEAWKPHLTKLAAEMNRALAAGDGERFRAELEKFNRGLDSLRKFLDRERAQGLLAVHAESGARIYNTEGRIYLATPDPQAFADYRTGEKAKELARFVKGITGVEVDPTKAFYQSDTSPGAGDLLNCRIDRLELSSSHSEYGVSTTVRKPSGTAEHAITFTKDQLAAGGLVSDASRGFGYSSTIPQIAFHFHDGAGGVPTNGDGTPPMLAGPTTAPPLAGDIEKPAQAAIAGPVQLPSREEQPIPGDDLGGAARATTLLSTAALQESFTPLSFDGVASTLSRYNPLQYGAATRNAEAEKTLAKAKTRIEKPMSDYPDADKIAKGIADAEKAKPEFDRAVATRRAAIETEMKKPGADQTALKAKLDELDELKASEVMRRRDLLQERLQKVPDTEKAVHAETKRKLISMKKDVDEAFDGRIARKTATGADVTALTDQKTKFATDLTKYADDLRGVFGKTGRWLSGMASWGAEKVGLKWVGDKLYAMGQTKLPGVGTVTGYNRLMSWMEKRAADAVAKSVTETESMLTTSAATLSADDAAKQLATLDAHRDLFQARIKTLEADVKAGKTGADTALKEMQDIQAKSVIRQQQLLEKQIADATAAGKDATALKTRLYSEMSSDVDQAYTHLKQGNTNACKAYARERKAYAPELERQQLAAAVEQVGAVRTASAAVKKAETALAAATAGSPQHAEHTAEVALRKAQLEVARNDARVAQLEKQIDLDPKNTTLAGELKTRQSAREAAVVVERKAGVDHAQARVARLDADLIEVDSKIAAASAEPKLVAELEKQRGKILAEQSDLRTTAESLGDNNMSAAQAKALPKLEQELAAKQKELAELKDASRKAQVAEEVKVLEGKVRAANNQLVARDLKATDASITRLKSELDAVKAELQTLNGQTTPRVGELQKLEKGLSGKIKGLELTKEYLTSKKEIYAIESRAAKADAAVVAKQKALDAAKAAKTPDATAIKALDDELKIASTEAATVQKELVTARQAFNKTWASRLAQAQENFAVRVVNGAERYAAKNPMKAATILAVASESIRGAGMAKYDPDTKHCFIPSLIFLLNQDLEDWSATTEQLTVPGAMAVEAGSHGGNALIISGGIYVIAKGVTTVASTKAGQVVTTAVVNRVAQSSFAQSKLVTALAPKVAQGFGPALVGVGSAVDGYLTFSDGSFVHHDNVQLTTATVSPIVAGAAGGGIFFGPPGAIVGAVGGAIGEVGGVTRGLFVLDAQIAGNWKRRGINESILLAEQGYVHADNDPILKTRNPDLSAEEKEVIEGHAQIKLLRTIFDPQKGLSSDELTKAGFKVVGADASPAERTAAGDHNWQRATELFTPGYVYSAPVEYLGDLGVRLKRERADAIDHYTKLYNHSMRRTYSLEGGTSTAYNASWDIANTYSFGLIPSSSGTSPGGIKTTSEFEDRVKEVAREFNTKFAARDKAATGADRAALAEEQWTFLASKFPQAGLIFTDKEARRYFLARFEVLGRESKGLPLEQFAAMTDIDKCDTGVAILARSTDDFAVTTQQAQLRTLTSGLNGDKLLDEEF